MMAHAMEAFGRLDFAINCAGIEGKTFGIGDMPEEEWDRVLDINLKGTYFCMKYESRAMLAFGNGGSIVSVVCPGITDTPMHRRARILFGDQTYDEFLGQRVHMKRAGLPGEITRSIAFLCSDDASYVTGTTLTPDGGFHLTV